MSGARSPLGCLSSGLAEQHRQVGIEVCFGYPLAAPVEHGEGDDRQAEQFGLDRAVKVGFWQVSEVLADLPAGEL